MSFSLKAAIFRLFGRYEKETDSYKDGNGKGIQERFNEAVAEDVDETLLPLIEGLHDNTKNPVSLWEPYLPLIESDRGIDLLSGIEPEQRRRFVRFINSLVAVKGTKKGYELLFSFLGMQLIALTEDFTGQTFDSGVPFDSENLLDSGGCGCTLYDLEVSGDIIANDDFYSYLLKAIKQVEPVTAKLRDLIYNNSEVSQFYPFALWSRNDASVSILINGDTSKFINIDWDAPTSGFTPSTSNRYAIGVAASEVFESDKLRRHDVYFVDETSITSISAASQNLRKNVNASIFSAIINIDLSGNSIGGFVFGKFAGNSGLVVDCSFNSLRSGYVLGSAISALAQIQANGSTGNQVAWFHNNSWQDGLSESDMDLIESNALQLYALGFNFVFSNFGFKNVI